MSEREEQGAKIAEVASRLGVPGQWLDALINFETGGTYDVFVKNPYSSARGLIQVLDSTAQNEFGAADSLALSNKYPTFASYMENVVWPYLRKYMPYSDKQSLYMAVFYPAYRNSPPSTIFPESVRKVNPGITTVQDYIDFVDRRIRTAELRLGKAIPILIAAVGIGVLAWLRSRG